MLKEFRDFIARGNVLDLAVAVIIGAAFGRIVTSMVEGILMPPLGVLLGSVDFSSLFIVLDRSRGIPASPAEAKTAGVPVIAYGAFINDVVNFVIIAFGDSTARAAMPGLLRRSLSGRRPGLHARQEGSLAMIPRPWFSDQPQQLPSRAARSSCTRTSSAFRG